MFKRCKTKNNSTARRALRALWIFLYFQSSPEDNYWSIVMSIDIRPACQKTFEKTTCCVSFRNLNWKTAFIKPLLLNNFKIDNFHDNLKRRNVFTLFVKDIWFSEFGTVSAIWQLDDPYKKNASLKMICIYELSEYFRHQCVWKKYMLKLSNVNSKLYWLKF